jgi:hypothetical protein
MTCARLDSLFAAAAVATLFQAGPIGAQPMTETSISTATYVQTSQVTGAYSPGGRPYTSIALRHNLEKFR